MATQRKKKKKKRVSLPTRRRPIPGRRTFMAAGGALLAAGTGLGSWLLGRGARAIERFRMPVRPPTASKDDASFQSACIRCGLCGTVCENGCIQYYAADETTHGALTPYLDVRRRACTLCMRCTQICPTNALRPVEDELPTIAREVKMGLAVVDPDLCLSYLGRVCGYCHDACPLPEEAITLTPPARPVVLTDGCVGCGRCVEACPQTPTAIDVWRELS